MSKLLKVTLLLALAVGMFGAYRHIAAQETEASKAKSPILPPTFDVQVSQDPNALATKHVLQGTYNNNGVFGPGTVSGSTSTPIDAQLTVLCPGTSGTCTIQADMWVENGGQTSTLDGVGIRLYVDGKAAPDALYSVGETPSDGSYVQSSSSQAVTGLAHGNHTVQTYFYSDNGANVAYYNSTYRVYKP